MSKRRGPLFPDDLLRAFEKNQRENEQRLLASPGYGRAIKVGIKTLAAARGPKKRKSSKEDKVLKLLKKGDRRTDLIANEARCSRAYVNRIKKRFLAENRN